MKDVLFLRKETESGVQLVFEFNVLGYRYLVKNLTEDDIYVGFTDGAEQSDMILIPAECAQTISINGGYRSVYVLPEGTSKRGVEVQCVKW